MSVVLVGLLFALPARGDDDDKKQPRRPPNAIRQLMDDTQSMGPWEGQFQIIDEATGNIFDQQGWDSEPDRYARGVMGEVGRIPPWRPWERQEVFMNSVQARYGLSHDQKTLFDSEMQGEGMKLTLKHMTTFLPIALEATRTRAKQEPFTAEQVQRWSRGLKPLIEDTRRSIERVAEKLAKTMTAEQRKLLETDMKAFIKRHGDVEKMVQKWESGHWNPSEWGLQNDPIHAAAMAEYLRIEAGKNALVDEALLAKPLTPKVAVPEDESSWVKYVKMFCRQFHCDERQTTQAFSILKSSVKEARGYRAAHRLEIEKLERLSKSAETQEQRRLCAERLDRKLAPIGQVFKRLCKRLIEEIPTTEQKRKYAPTQEPKLAGSTKSAS